jgi:hypothetical protein
MDLQSTLLNVPANVLHPPTHEAHVSSLYVSFLAVKRCLNLEAMAVNEPQNVHGDPGAVTTTALSLGATCQAWTLLAEIGLLIIGAGFGGANAPDWSQGIEREVENAVSKGLQICAASKVCATGLFWLLTLMAVLITIWLEHTARILGAPVITSWTSCFMAT